MEKIALADEWKSIASAPANADLELSIYDGGEYHALVFPCRRQGIHWRDVKANRLMRQFQPTHWRPWPPREPLKSRDS